jgi:DNA repair exonuclease SbcCD nuclease subunit
MAYGLIADVHCHNWSAFSSVNAGGVNTRLQMILDEMVRCAHAVKAAGGNRLVIAGDLFHVRGSIAPTVLNPVKDTLDFISAPESEDGLGIEVEIEPGNHDLEGKEVTRVSSAITSLAGPGVRVIDQVTARDNMILVPWIEDISKLKEELKNIKSALSGHELSTCDLILHAPIDEVIPGLPAHGLTAAWLADLGFKRVFAGHYHNHKDFGNGVYSIGAIAHHTWSDVGSKAGFLIVSDDSVKWHKSHAPEFIDITTDMERSDVEILAEGNYVRAKIRAAKNSDIEAGRKWLLDNGAKGVVIQPIKEAARARVGATVKAGASIDVSIGDYIKSKPEIENKEAVARAALAVLAEARV